MSSKTRPFTRHLTDDGTTGGSKEANVNGSVTPVKFWFESESRANVARVILTIIDSGMTATRYGGVVSLTNGIKLEVIDTDGTTVLNDLFDGACKDIPDLRAVSHDLNRVNWGSGDDALSMRLSFNKYSENGVVLLPGQRLQLTVQDDLTGITTHRVVIQGEYIF